MSLLWPERIALHIGPEVLRLAHKGALELAYTTDWATSLAALPALPRFARVHVSVADRHARYLRVVWPEGLKAGERQAFVDHRFQAVFGPGPWVTQADRGAWGATCMAAALSGDLLAALKEWARARRLRLTAIEPAFAADYGRNCRRFRGDGAFARLEAGRVTLGLWRAGEWQALRSQPVEQADGVAAAHCLATLLASIPAEEVLSGGTLHLAGALPPVGLLPAGWSCAGLEAAS